MSSPRPRKTDDAILTATATSLAADFCQEWASDFPPDQESMEILIEDLRDSLENSGEMDGYLIARAMDVKGYEPDARMVGILQRAYSYMVKHLRAACEKWVREAGLTPLAIGTHVTCAECEGIGEILGHHPDGRSTVCFRAMGHSPHGPNRGRILEWESLTPVTPDNHAH